MKKPRSGGFLISKIHLLAGRVFNRKLKAYDVGDLEAGPGRIMFVLWTDDNIPIRALSEKTLLGMSTLTSMLDRLEAKGYVRRVRSETDRRVVLIQRTRKDDEFQKIFMDVSREMGEIFYKGFSEKEIDVIEKYLERILKNLME